MLYIIGEIKIFKILSDKYRCRKKRFELRLIWSVV
jgi:hypothetical protein